MLRQRLALTRCLRQELELLEDDARVFKLVGPALVRQPLSEARANVGRRMQYIGDEM